MEKGRRRVVGGHGEEELEEEEDDDDEDDDSDDDDDDDEEEEEVATGGLEVPTGADGGADRRGCSFASTALSRALILTISSFSAMFSALSASSSLLVSWLEVEARGEGAAPPLLTTSASRATLLCSLAICFASADATLLTVRELTLCSPDSLALCSLDSLAGLRTFPLLALSPCV